MATQTQSRIRTTTGRTETRIRIKTSTRIGTSKTAYHGALTRHLPHYVSLFPTPVPPFPPRPPWTQQTDTRIHLHDFAYA